MVSVRFGNPLAEGNDGSARGTRTRRPLGLENHYEFAW